MNNRLFSTQTKAPVADAVNEAGGLAYQLSDKEALAKFACTGTFNDTYYASGQNQLDTLIEMANRVSDNKFLADLAIYSRNSSFMKDMPAALLAILASRPNARYEFERAFPQIIHNGKMLRNFCQCVRSGKFGRRSFGSLPKRMINNYLNSLSEGKFLSHYIGNDPTLGDIIKMTHPRPVDTEHDLMFNWAINGYTDHLVPLINEYTTLRDNPNLDVSNNIPWMMLTNIEVPFTMERGWWSMIAQRMNWHALRINLNTLLRHRVFEDSSMVDYVASRLRNREEINRNKVFPYQIFAAYQNVETGMPRKIIDALHDAVELSINNVPEFDGHTTIIVDVSGSMGQPVTGHRVGVSSKVRCVDVAALMASIMMRKSNDFTLIPVDTQVHLDRFEPRDSVFTNATKLARFGGGGTALSMAVNHMVDTRVKTDRIIIISDNMSWADYYNGTYSYYGGRNNSTPLHKLLTRHYRNVPVVNIDIVPSTTTQTKSVDGKVLNVSGFSDAIFEVMRGFFSEKTNFVDIISQ